MTLNKTKDNTLSLDPLLEHTAARASYFLESIHSSRPVNGLTHNFYRYPARFSPEFAKVIIENFSEDGDTILDPFMGGGTAVVEGLMNKRRVIGLDVNPLAVFLARVKSTPLSRHDLVYLRNWANKLPKQLKVHPEATLQYQQEDCFKNIPWWIRNQILRLSRLISKVEKKSIQASLRCALLKTGQWALDCKKTLPTSKQFLDNFYITIIQMCEGMEEYRSVIKEVGLLSNKKISSHRRLLLCSAVKTGENQRIPKSWLPVRLVVTSPPYPGVHILYHRWQVRGRKETPVLFNIIQRTDGHMSSYYTLGARRTQRGEENYFQALTVAYKSVAKLLDYNSLIIQLVAFSKPKKQINLFMQSMDQAGYKESLPPKILTNGSARIWRRVPNRKWYTNNKTLSSSKELLLFHRLKS